MRSYSTDRPVMSETNSQQCWNPEQYAESARFVSDLGLPVLELLAPHPGEHILDLGCGDGALTLKLKQRGCEVFGVDASPAMVAAATALGLSAERMAGQALSFHEEFDAVFSNAALHWMKDPQLVIAGVWRALKPGGRFVGELGGHGNVAAIVAALEAALARRDLRVSSPWFFPSVATYRTLLEASHFTVRQIELFPRPTPLPGAMSDWLTIFAQPFSAALPADQRAAFIAEVAEALRPQLCSADGRWQADYVRLRFAAEKAEAASAMGG